jgi:hypothetical protein
MSGAHEQLKRLPILRVGCWWLFAVQCDVVDVFRFIRAADGWPQGGIDGLHSSHTSTLTHRHTRGRIGADYEREIERRSQGKIKSAALAAGKGINGRQ